MSHSSTASQTRDGQRSDGQRSDARDGNARNRAAEAASPRSPHAKAGVDGSRENLPVERTIIPPFPHFGPDAKLGDKLKGAMAWLQSTRPMRVFKHFGESNGSILAGGMSYSAIFSLFAAVWALFSAMALILADNQGLKDLVLGGLQQAAPDLVGEEGVIKPSILDQAGAFGITGLIAIVGSAWTALGWLSGGRAAIRKIFEVPVSPPTNFALLKLKDLGIALAFGLAMILSSLLTVASQGALKWLVSFIGIGEDNPISLFLLRAASMLVVLAADTVILALLMRVLTGLRIPTRTLIIGALIGGVLIQILKLAGSALLGGASSNPIAASFAVLLGVLIFFNLLCTVLLLTASWIKVTMDDLGESPRKLTAKEADEEAAVAELDARRERLAADRIRLTEELERTPRFARGRRALRRDYERVITEERTLHEEDKRRRLGLNAEGVPDPAEPERSEQKGFTEDAAPQQEPDFHRDHRALREDAAADAAAGDARR